jgi:hypothetical protein
VPRIQVDFEVEDCHWVPKAAIDATLSLIARFPDIPSAPFMSLLTQLNKVWRQRELERLRELQTSHEKELGEFQRSHRQATPYQQAVMHQRLNHLKSELKQSRTSPEAVPSAPALCRTLCKANGSARETLGCTLQTSMHGHCPSIG